MKSRRLRELVDLAVLCVSQWKTEPIRHELGMMLSKEAQHRRDGVMSSIEKLKPLEATYIVSYMMRHLSATDGNDLQETIEREI